MQSLEAVVVHRVQTHTPHICYAVVHVLILLSHSSAAHMIAPTHVVNARPPSGICQNPYPPIIHLLHKKNLMTYFYIFQVKLRTELLH